MKTILCFGDSNTWGHPPVESLTKILPRYSIHVRWPGVMRDQLGEGYHVIEEGLSGRTTVFSDPVEGDHKNGRTYLLPCLETAAPVDLVIIMLGTNDLKTRFSATAFDIAWGMSQLAGMALNSAFGPNKSTPKVLIISPIKLGKLTFFADILGGSEEKSYRLGKQYRYFADLLNCEFLDAAEIIEASDIDGVHFEPAEHQKLGMAVTAKVREILS